VEISEKGISELDRSTRVVFIPKAEIVRVQVAYGCASESPGLQSLVGAGLVCLGFVSLVGICRIFIHGGRLFKLSLGLPLLIVVGGWLRREVVTKQVYLLVVTHAETRKIVLRGPVESKVLADFLQEAKRDFGFDFEVDEPLARGEPTRPMG